MSLGRLLLVLSSSARRYEWRLTFDHFIIPDWSKTSVSCQYWFTSNRFMTAIKAQLGSSLTILVSTCSCLCWYWFGEITSADVVSEFSQILQGLFFFLLLLINWTIWCPGGLHLMSPFVSHVPVSTLFVPLLSPATSWWRWWRYRTVANRRRCVAMKRLSSASPLTPKMTTWWVILSSPWCQRSFDLQKCPRNSFILCRSCAQSVN